MTKLRVLVVMSLLLFFCSSIANAWTVTIVNNSEYDVKCEIKGEHLFWVQTDCTTVVRAKSNGSCEMPAGICPSGGHFEYGLSHDYPRGAKCWDSILTIYHTGNLLHFNWQP
jgi:hypothetical protein